ncbi:MAG: hypothetical protein COW71_12130 [Ignavibacteriales bacterium CG18_big_fil_WC_8_21_14_2_50_31_20]|nr:MAG: hypothetical protein COW71_12130 [Ignavibacteriales bacterium CG18_big_fil_WC_8_21_14_2_50_31_20]
MTNAIITNISLLIILSYGYSFLYQKQDKINKNLYNLLSGILFGLICVAGMFLPVHYSNGIIFDGRSIILSIGAFFCGPIVATISVIIASIYRIIIGGGGTFVGLGVIFTSSIIGLLYRQLVNEKNSKKIINLYFLGIAVHVSMMLWMLALPGKSSNDVIIELTLPILIIYPIASVIISKILIDRKIIADSQVQIFANKEKYRLLVNNQIDLLIKLDFKGRFLFASPSYCKTFGVMENDILGNEFLPLVHHCDIEKTIKAKQMLLNPPYTCYFEERAKSENGWRWFAWNNKAVMDKNGEIENIIGLGRDITEQKKAEEALKNSEEKLTLFIKNSNDIYILINKNGKQIFVSDAAYELTGYKTEELMVEFDQLIHPDDLAIVRAKWNEIVNNKDKKIKAEYRHMHKSKGYVWFEAVAQNYFDNPLINAAIINVRDITERKKYDEELKKMKDNLVIEVEEKTKELKERISELEHFYNATIERELRMKEMKDEITLLKSNKSK